MGSKIGYLEKVVPAIGNGNDSKPSTILNLGFYYVCVLKLTHHFAKRANTYTQNTRFYALMKQGALEKE